MNHGYLLCCIHEKCRPKAAIFIWCKVFLLAFLGVFALLVGNAAAGLAGRLAGSLAFAAAAILRALAQIAGLDGLNVLHNSTSRIKVPLYGSIFRG